MITKWSLYKNGWVPFQGNPKAAWLEGANAFTATTEYIPFSRMAEQKQRAESATLIFVWQARSPASYVGVGVFMTAGGQGMENKQLGDVSRISWFCAADDSGPAPWTPNPGVASGPNVPGVHPWWLDITADFNALIGEAQDYNMAQATFGNNNNGPLVYEIGLQVVWALPGASAQRRPSPQVSRSDVITQRGSRSLISPLTGEPV